MYKSLRIRVSAQNLNSLYDLAHSTVYHSASRTSVWQLSAVPLRRTEVCIAYRWQQFLNDEPRGNLMEPDDEGGNSSAYQDEGDLSAADNPVPLWHRVRRWLPTAGRSALLCKRKRKRLEYVRWPYLHKRGDLIAGWIWHSLGWLWVSYGQLKRGGVLLE